MKTEIKVRGVITSGDELLCVQHKDYITGEVHGWWSIPGGGVDEGEELLTALKREMIEETGVAAKVGNLLFIQEFFDKKNNQYVLELFFHVTNAGDYRQVDLSATTHGEAEIADIGFFKPKEITLLPHFLTTENLAEIIKNPCPTKIYSEI